MARIEIPMDEYQGMKDKIKDLENKLVQTEKELEQANDKRIKLHNYLEDVVNMSLFDRLFNWKSNLKLVLENDYEKIIL